MIFFIHNIELRMTIIFKGCTCMLYFWRYHNYSTPKALLGLRYLERLLEIAYFVPILDIRYLAAHKPHPTTRHPPIAVKKNYSNILIIIFLNSNIGLFTELKQEIIWMWYTLIFETLKKMFNFNKSRNLRFISLINRSVVGAER